MKTWPILAPMVVLACLCTGCDLGFEPGAEHVSSQFSRTLVTTPGTAPWSKGVNGLSGRLLLERENLQPGLRYAVFLELRNASTDRLVCTNQPDLAAQLFDSNSRPVPTATYPMSGSIPRALGVELEPGVYAGFRVDVQTMGVPPGKTILLAIGGYLDANGYGSQAWSLSEGRYTLRVQASFLPLGNAGFCYRGRIDLPPVEISVSGKDLGN